MQLLTTNIRTFVVIVLRNTENSLPVLSVIALVIALASVKLLTGMVFRIDNHSLGRITRLSVVG